MQTANALLETFGVPPRIAPIPQLPSEAKTAMRVPASAEGVSRRAFFDLLAREATRTTVVAIASVFDSASAQGKEEPKKGELRVRVPVKRQMLLNFLQRIGKPVVNELASNLWAQFGFNENCTGCQMCAVFCPRVCVIVLDGGIEP